MWRVLYCAIFVLLQPNDKLLVSSASASTSRECVLRQETMPNCNGMRYQSLNGSCNNPLNPFYGKSWTPFKRLVPPSYGNKISSPRLATNGRPLTLSRVISNAFNKKQRDSNPNSTSVNAMFVQFAQYLTHDLAGTPSLKEENGVPVSCACSNPNPTCLVVTIPRDDPFYSDEVTCISRLGSAVATACSNMTDLPQENVNRLSAFVDAENVYGWSEDLLADLRDPDSDYGALRLVDPAVYKTTANDPESPASVSESSGCPLNKNDRLLLSLQDLQPYLASRFDCPAHIESPVCFASGDDRANENIGLASTHLLFTREHNRVAMRLKALNSMWSSDRIFEEARRIVIAIHQIITYNEYLPLLLGPKLIREFDLDIVKEGFYYGYDVTYDATISNAFTTAAFRYGHSQVGEFFHRPQPNYVDEEDPSIRMFKGLFFQEAVINGSSPAIMRGLMVDPAKRTDLQFVSDLRDRMFESATQVGQDLLSVNIERGRLHGLSSYNSYRDFCGFQKFNTWSDLQRVMPASTVDILEDLYESIDDIDLYVGGIAESPLPQANVGPTFGCIIGYQFRDLKKGDRFWFENPGQFTSDQLEEIRKVTFSSVLCNNMNGMTTISPRAMELEGDSNTRIPCSQVPQMNLESWKVHDVEQDGVWTRWFPAEDSSTVDLLQKVILNNPESVCPNPLDYEMEPVTNGDKFTTRIRYRCPIGSISNGAFPNVKDNLNYYWTVWFNRDTPGANGDDVESLELIQQERPREICDQPLYMQAVTKEGLSAFDSSELFTTLTAKKGLICRGASQSNRQCRDYKVRFYCPKKDLRGFVDETSLIEAEIPDGTWTEWINTVNPRVGNFDLESIRTARRRRFNICRSPLLIQARVAGTNISVDQTGDVLKRFSIYHGLVCDNRAQTNGQCRDYEVRYFCSPSVTFLNRI